MSCDSPPNWIVAAKPPPRLHPAMYRPNFADPRRGPDLMHATIVSLGPLGELGCAVGTLVEALTDIEADPFLFVLTYIDAEMGGHAELSSTRKPPAAQRLRSAVIAALRSRGASFKPQGGTRPHVTLHYKWRTPSVYMPIEPIVWLIDEIQLIESITGEGRHECHGTFPITPRQGMLFPLTRCAA